MSKLRVLQIVEDLNIGGLERVLAAIALNLNNEKYDVRVWCLSKGGSVADELVSAGIHVRVLGLKNYHNPLNILKLVRLFKHARIDIIHSHGYFASTFGRLAAIIARVPVIVAHVHTTYFNFKNRHIYTEKILAFFTDKIICVSKATQLFVNITEKISPKKTCLIYNGCSFSRLNNTCNLVPDLNRSITDSDFVAVTVGSLVPHKGHRWLINAIGNLTKKHTHIKLIIVGDGPLRNCLESYARQNNLSSNIIFAGLQKDVRPFLNKADVFILPSIEREGLGLALIEAMSVNLPLIGSNIGGIPEVIINNVNGVLVEPNSVIDMSKAIENLINDPVSRIKMGQEGRKRYLKMFTVDRMTQNISKLYDELSKLNLQSKNAIS